MLRKGVYPYEYVDEWEKFNEITLPESRKFHSNFNIEDVKDIDCIHAKRVCKEFLEVDVQQPEKLHELHNDLPFLTERMKLGQVEKLPTSLHDRTEYVIHVRNLKQALNHGLNLKKIHRVIKFNQQAWLKPYIDMNTKLRQKAKNNFRKYFFMLVDNGIFGRTTKNKRKHGNIKLVTTERRRNYLVSEPNYHTTIFFI